MTDNIHKVFVYGTLKRGHGNHRLLAQGGADFLGEARTKDPVQLYASGVPYMARAKTGGLPAVGELYMVDDDTRLQLDRLEGHPDFYRREELMVVDLETGEETLAEAYFVQHQNRKVRSVAVNAEGFLEWERRVAPRQAAA